MRLLQRIVLLLMTLIPMATAAPPVVSIDTPMPPPEWALLERELLRANSAACEAFYERYFDDRGFLLCVERWGGNDGPDDAIENLLHWPILHALGSSPRVLELYKHAWEGHLRQYTLARTSEVPFARDGMYYKEFPVMFDWLHNSEGLTVFNLQGLSDPYNRAFGQRARRFAGFYMNDDPGAPNYDPQHKIIRSMFNGSRGPLLRKATALDWAGDPIEVENRFQPRHGEHTYQQFLEHFKDYNDVVGDHPQNLAATSLALNAYMLNNEPRYRQWLLEYVDAWRERMAANEGIIPSNVGLDGTIGGAAGGRWYGGVYGWGFTMLMPPNGTPTHRNNVHLAFDGFMNAYLLTGDDKYLDPWRQQLKKINAHVRMIDGKPHYPHMHGSQGWYHFTPEPYNKGALELYYLSQREEDHALVPAHGWLEYVAGRRPSFAEEALRRDLSHVRRMVEGFHADTSTPDTRLADDSMRFNPCSVTSLVELAMGGLIGGKNRLVLHARLRYFDADNRRAGLPEGVAALIERMTPDSVTLSLVNVDQVEPRTVVVQGGSYGEHQFKEVRLGSETKAIDDAHFSVRLAPGSGAKLVLTMDRHSNQPTWSFPWDRAI